MAKKDINSVILIGTMIREPEIKYTPAGKAIANIAIANNQSFTNGNETKEIVSYFSVTAYGQTAVNVQKFLHKGSKIAICGYLKQDRWTDQQTGKTVTKINVIAEQIQFISHSATPGQTAPQQQNQQQQYQQQTQNLNQQYQQQDGQQLPQNQQYRSQTTPPPAQQNNQSFDPWEDGGSYGVLASPDDDIPF